MMRLSRERNMYRNGLRPIEQLVKSFMPRNGVDFIETARPVWIIESDLKTEGLGAVGHRTANSPEAHQPEAKPTQSGHSADDAPIPFAIFGVRADDSQLPHEGQQ